MNVVCYCDATYSSEDGIAYYGYIIKSKDQKYKDVGKIRELIAKDSTRAELRTIEKLISEIEEKFKDSNIQINCDAQGVIEPISGDGTFKKEDLRNIMNRINNITHASENNYQFNWIRRENNIMADKLAEEAKISDNKEEYEESFDKNWQVKRKTEYAYIIYSKNNEILCHINKKENKNTCKIGAKKCRHRFFLDRMLNEDKTHKIIDQ